jgi:hypothetical protein
LRSGLAVSAAAALRAAARSTRTPSAAAATAAATPPSAWTPIAAATGPAESTTTAARRASAGIPGRHWHVIRAVEVRLVGNAIGSRRIVVIKVHAALHQHRLVSLNLFVLDRRRVGRCRRSATAFTNLRQPKLGALLA